MTTRTVCYEIQVDVSDDAERVIEPDVAYALRYLAVVRTAIGRSGEWYEVPGSASDYLRLGATRVRWSVAQ